MGRRQFPIETRLALTTSKTSPGIAKTFSSRAARDIAGGGVGAWMDSRTGGRSSIIKR